MIGYQSLSASECTFSVMNPGNMDMVTP
jgi:hypothetical protein